MCETSAIADKEAADARHIKMALKKAFDEIDDDGGCVAPASQACPLLCLNGVC
eukprot:COSAG02_NODE_435_length_22393_cov_18.805643_11_plen_53_part_00